MPTHSHTSRSSRKLRGFTLIEVLIATVITVILVGALATAFSWVNDNVTDSRATAELSDKLRHVKQLLQTDLSGITAPLRPPLNPGQGLGYFEYVEGDVGPSVRSQMWGAYTSAASGLTVDSTVGDPDDFLFFTTRCDPKKPFVGRWYRHPDSYTTITSSTAEVCWFLTGNTLHRRYLLVYPGVDPSEFHSSIYQRREFYAWYDISMRQQGGFLTRHLDEMTKSNNLTSSLNVTMIHSNSLGDLTKRENRYSHPPLAFPHDPRVWASLESNVNGGIPTSEDTTCVDRSQNPSGWPFPMYEPLPTRGQDSDPRPEYWPLDSTEAPQAYLFPFRTTTMFFITPDMRSSRLAMTPVCYSPLAGNIGPYATPDSNLWSGMDKGALVQQGENGIYRNGRDDDIVMSNVLSFDVKVWDPGAPIFKGTTTTSGGQEIAITPEDPGYFTFRPTGATTTYIGALPRFISAPVAANAPISFGAFVDLNYMGGANYATALNTYEASQGLPANTLPRPRFGDRGNDRSCANYFVAPPNGTLTSRSNNDASAVYDTWSTHYESDGLDNNRNGLIDEGRNGIDDIIPPATTANGMIDDPTELESPPPYTAPITGIQIRIRCFDPTTRQIREVTLTNEFLDE